MNEIRIYVEGGGSYKDTRIKLRDGLLRFLGKLKAISTDRSIPVRLIACGARNSAYELFTFAQRDHPKAFNILLVDSETPVTKPVWEHLRNQDNWQLRSKDDQHCHLMVQAMEAWLIADIEALANYYQQNFNRKAIPKATNVEGVEKARLEPALKAATRKTSKGEYHKIRHASELLAVIDPEKVRQASSRCDRFFNVLTTQINQTR